MIFKWFKKLFKKNKPLKPHEIRPSLKHPSYYTTALKELGVSEVYGKIHNERIIEYHEATDLSASTDEIAWCSSFVNWCLKENQMPRTNKANARSFLSWGKAVDIPRIGDIVVFWRVKKDGWQGHVGFFAGFKDGKILVLGGNQDNKVCYKLYSKDQLLGYRRLSN